MAHFSSGKILFQALTWDGGSLWTVTKSFGNTLLAGDSPFPVVGGLAVLRGLIVCVLRFLLGLWVNFCLG